jgi:hypothetical protein
MHILRRRRTRLISLLSVMAILAGTIVVQFNLAGATSLVDTFELDGNPQQSDAAGDDWEILDLGDGIAEAKTAIPVVDGADPPTDTSYFKGGGSKDERNVTQWAYSGTDVAPDKDEIVNAAAAAYLVPDQGSADSDSEDDLVIAFHADRFSNDGDAAIGFWFFKNRITLGNGRFNGTHADGDVLVVSDFNEGENINTIRVFKWQGGALTETAIPGGNAAKDCQESNHNDFVCATENRTGDVDAVWPYTPKSNVGVPMKYPAFTFLEGAINVSAVVPNSDECFATFLAETRSSTSTTAQLKDFVLGDFPVCAPGTTLTASPAAGTPEIAVAGDEVDVTFTETNSGNVALTNVYVAEDSPLCTLSPASVATLAEDASQAFSCTVATSSDSAQNITITGTGHGMSALGDVTYCDNPNSPPANTVCDQNERASAEIVTIIPGTQLSASASPTTAKEGDTITYTITEENDGIAPSGYDSSLALADVGISSGSSDCNGTLTAPVKTGGDDDPLLELGETWTYQCTVAAPADDFTLDFTGTGTVLKGTSHARTVTYCDPCSASQFHDEEERASASVTVISPSTELTITASATITYTFSEKNDSGDAPLAIPDGSTDRTKLLTLGTDSTQLCNVSAIAYSSGDGGAAYVLDVGETWVFSCQGSLAGPSPDNNGSGSSSSTLVGIGHGKDATDDDVTYPTDPDERDRVKVTIDYFPRGG